MVELSKLRSFNLKKCGPRDTQISRDAHLVNVTFSIVWRNLILDACTCDRTFSAIMELSQPYRDTVGEKGQKLFQKLKALLFLDNSRLTATE